MLFDLAYDTETIYETDLLRAVESTIICLIRLKTSHYCIHRDKGQVVWFVEMINENA